MRNYAIEKMKPVRRRRQSSAMAILGICLLLVAVIFLLYKTIFKH
ncbi:MAG TPA: hypothetical protein VGM41_08325 [Chitinophagaceae bacterium]|jgi:hypothetical protein